MDMPLSSLFRDKRQTIVNKWFDSTVESYPPDAARLMKGNKDHFANPVGSTIRNALERIFDEITSETCNQETVSSCLDEIVRIRAVQAFTPSNALSFIFRLKDILGEIAGEKGAEVSDAERESFDRMIDQMVLNSFDLYMKCREKIYEIKANEVKSMTFRLLQRANLLVEKDAQDNKGMEEDKNTLNIK